MSNLTKIQEQNILTEEYTFYEDKRIWSKRFKRFLKGHVRKDGYVQVGLKCKNGKYGMFYWHRVIWFVFNGEIPDGYEINHKNEIKTDNRLSNLECISHLENIQYGTGIERRTAKLKGIPKSEEHKAKLRNHPNESKAVVAVDMDDNVVYEFPSIAEAGRNGFCDVAVGACCRNCYSTHKGNYYKGLRWYYLEDWLKIKGVA